MKQKGTDCARERSIFLNECEMRWFDTGRLYPQKWSGYVIRRSSVRITAVYMSCPHIVINCLIIELKRFPFNRLPFWHLNHVVKYNQQVENAVQWCTSTQRRYPVKYYTMEIFLQPHLLVKRCLRWAYHAGGVINNIAGKTFRQWHKWKKLDTHVWHIILNIVGQKLSRLLSGITRDTKKCTQKKAAKDLLCSDLRGTTFIKPPYSGTVRQRGRTSKSSETVQKVAKL